MPDNGTDADEAENRYTFTFGSGEYQPVATILEAVAWVKGTDEFELEPLEHVIDTGALGALVRERDQRGDFYRATGDRPGPDLQITFDYEGCRVTVEPGRISIEPHDID